MEDSGGMEAAALLQASHGVRGESSASQFSGCCTFFSRASHHQCLHCLLAFSQNKFESSAWKPNIKEITFIMLVLFVF